MCRRCREYPCRCVGGVDVIAEHNVRVMTEANDLYAQAVAHMKNIPDGHTPWPERKVGMPPELAAPFRGDYPGQSAIERGSGLCCGECPIGECEHPEGV